MNILRIYPILPPRPGGMEKHIFRLTEEQRKLGHNVTVAFNHGEATAPSDIRVLPFFNLLRIQPQVLFDLVFYFFLLIKIVQQRQCFDVVHVHGDWSAFFCAQLVAKLTKSKLVGSFHGVARYGKWRGVYRLAFKRYSMIYATGTQETAYFNSFNEVPVRWQHSGIDPVFFDTVVDRVRSYDVISVGSFVPIKNFDLIVKIAFLMPNAKFIMIGDGLQKNLIEATCRSQAISNITFVGHLTPSEVAQQLRNARIFLSTSFAEGTPTALLEAMACGLAVVTSKSNDYDELIKPGKNGYIIEGFQANCYVKRIQELLDDESLLLKISRRNTEQAISYGWPEVAKRITEWMTAL